MSCAQVCRDLVSPIQRAEADDTVKVLVFKSAGPDYLIAIRARERGTCGPRGLIALACAGA
jgi:hypothetical protein